MGKTDWGIVIMGGGALFVGAYVWMNWKTVCPRVFGAGSPTCAGATPLAAVEGIFTSGARYMSDQAPATSRLNTNPNANKNAAIAMKQQQTINPTSKAGKEIAHIAAPKNQEARKNDPLNSPCTGPHPEQYPFCSYYTNTNSFATVTLNKVSIR